LSASGRPERPADGILVINKAAGWTSFDVVARVRRLTNQRRAGHAGTLDPAATGVLPICLGLATRVVEYLGEQGKAYRATIHFGIETDTYDREGAIVAEHPLPSEMDRAAIEAMLPRFTGTVMQVPPMYSALKHNGQRLYDLARAGQEVERLPRPVQIDRLTILAWQPPLLDLEIACGKGTYIRSLAHDLGQVFGCGAMLEALQRTRVGPFTLAESVSLDDLASDGWQKYLLPIDAALTHLRAVTLTPEQEVWLRQGRDLALPGVPGAPDEISRAYAANSAFLGVLVATEAGMWHPHKVFPPSPDE
jgi:tRNA pseudouridine55 synthase